MSDGGPPRIVRLDGASSSLVIDCRAQGGPRVVHWGARLPPNADLDALADADWRVALPGGMDRPVAPSLIPQTGLGHFGHPGLAGRGAPGDGRWLQAVALSRVDLGPDGAVLRLADPVAAIAVDLAITMDPANDMLVLSSRLENRGDGPFTVDWLAAATLPLPLDAGEALILTGRWNREFNEARLALPMGQYVRENRRGRTSHDQFPGLIAGPPGFGADHGAVHAVHLGWSGNHRLSVETGIDGDRLVQAGELLAPGEIVLAPGESYETPALYAAFAPDGLNGVMARFHGHAESKVIPWPGARRRPRPVHLNTWEAVYFDHDLDRLKALADGAADLGIERFVLDDGWFVGRDSDTTSLGDWTPDPRKWPTGLAPLIDHVRGLGLQFGLWVEPEMVNPDSRLYRDHPDWAMALPGRDRPTQRNQLVLDLSQDAVFDHILAALDRLLADNPIDYLKWDMNRDLAPGGGMHGAPTTARQTRALYRVLDALQRRFPEVEIESCASGGGRVDMGILAHTQRFWTSDCNDALDRQSIQRGFSLFFPPSVMGAHVGPAECHTTGRRLDIGFRALTAFFGHFGVEADVSAMAEDERAELARWIALHKRHRDLLHGGRARRLDLPDKGRIGHGVVALDAAQALFAIVQIGTSDWRTAPPVRLTGLDPGASYRLSLPAGWPQHLPLERETIVGRADDRAEPRQRLIAGDLVLDGASLSRAGLRLPPLQPQSGVLIHLERV